MTRVKICGLTLLQDIAMVNAVKPDYVGFVFAPSRRQVSFSQASHLRSNLSSDIVSVGVFVNETIENVLSLTCSGVIDMIQLHGSEDEAYIRALKIKSNKPIIKALAVEKRGDVQKWNLSSVDYLLLDSRVGGSGTCFDWSLIGCSAKPFFIAGGLHLGNVKDAINCTKAFAVDVSSGVEREEIKDFNKIEKFIRRVRNGL
ncbi:MAG: phosphoribosylanthranilate isomerase [Lachnospiraceae bacterium]|nr:phosphoribosylanthranilate isomerase [Lachnospiraceae bacterium]